MFEGFVTRMVDRAIPTYCRDPEEESLARDVAEYAVRQTARVAGIAGVSAGIAGVTLFVMIAVILYMYFPRQWTGQRPSEVTSAAPPARAEEDAKLPQANGDLQTKLDDVTKERDTLQGKLTASEEQVAELNKKLQAAQAVAVPKITPQPAKKVTGSFRTPVLASRPNTYRCGDGRTVRNAAACLPANTSAPGVVSSPASAFKCGDGRTVRNPAECKPAAPGR